MSMTFERRARGQDTNKRDGPKITKPDPNDFHPDRVANKIKEDAFCHPATVVPLFGSIGLVVCAVAIPATALVAGSLVGLGLIASGASWYFNYMVKGEEKVAQRYATLRAQQKQYEEQEMRALATDCNKAGFTQGAEAAVSLMSSYHSLRDFIEENTDMRKGVNLQRFNGLAEDTHQQGRLVLAQALTIHKAINKVAADIKVLEKDIAKCKKQRTELGTEVTTKTKALDRKIALGTKRIDLYSQKQDKLDEFLVLVSEIESALQTTYLELADLGTNDLDSLIGDGSGAYTRLQSATDAARSVEEKLKALGVDDTEQMLNEYLEKE